MNETIKIKRQQIRGSIQGCDYFRFVKKLFLCRLKKYLNEGIYFIYCNYYAKKLDANIMKLRIRAFALTTGITLGVVILALTWLYVILGYESYPLFIFSNVLPFYDITFWGGIIGLIWGFIYGLIGGALFALLYNTLSNNFT